ncbi:MAG: calcium/sodium antiporter [Alteromonadaceae bacterium]|uniref:Calcium/sodium antiporter n=1 Tax=Hydrocarboniclastica marina TaxID=2259620 RepID=A0A4P7XM92_9ALTE|nr:calcium/sodium antiporter [Alteromonadaceae bacterium]QCF27754.1 calcium/sodium antiporter [Hydrocarboniclastica marina]
MAWVAVIVGLIVLIWSADRFVDGASGTARYAGMPPLLIGMIIVGFGTSAPEMVISAFAASEGNPGIALGNAYGSNISNIALILGFTAVLSPIFMRNSAIRRELPLLTLATLVAGWQLWDGELSRMDGIVLLLLFFVIMGYAVFKAMRGEAEPLGGEPDSEVLQHSMSLGRSLFWLVLGLVLLIISSRALVWGAVEVARALGVTDLVIGLTVVAIGTSLPELASSLAAVRKGEHDLAFGNILGSNIFNTLAVVGIAATIQPMSVEPVVLWRDWSIMIALTLGLFIMAWGFRILGPGRITRPEGGLMLVLYAGYLYWVVTSATT